MPDNKLSLESIIGNPVLLLLGTVAVLILLIVPIVWLAMHGLLTAVALTGFFAIIFLALAQSRILNPEKQRWASPVVVVTLIAVFLFGYYGEATGSFYITPLSEAETTAVPPMLANVPTVISANLTVILVLSLLVAVVIGLTVRRP